MSLGIGIVVRGVGAGVALGGAKIGQQEGDRLLGHGRAIIRMDSQTARLHAFALDAVCDELLGEIRGLFRARSQPTT